MELKFKNIIIIILIFIIGAITIFWFKNNSYIMGGDAPFMGFPYEIIKSLLTSWTNKYFLGISTTTYTNESFPYLTFWALFKILGFKLLTVEKIWQFCLTISTGFSFYYLIKSFYPKLKTPAMALAVLYYMVCPFVFVLYTPPSNSLILSLIFTPLLLGLIHNLFQNNNKKYIYLIALSSTLLIGLGVNIPTLITSFLPSFIYIFLKAIKFKKNIEPFKKLLLATIYSFIINSFWIGQLLLSFNSKNVVATVDPSWLARTSSDATLFNILRSLGYWSFNELSTAFGSPYTIYSGIYNTIFYYVLSAILFLIILLSIFNRKKYYWFFVVVFICAIFMAKGPNAPFGNIFIWCYEHIPYFNIFREPWTKFTNSILLSGSILFGLGLDFIYNKIINIKKSKIITNTIIFIVTLIVAYTIVMYSLPFFNGKIIPTDRGNYPGTLADVPNYYIELIGWINNNSDIKRVILLPGNIFYQIHLFWGPDGYYGADPIYENTTQSTVSINPGGGYIVPKLSEKILTSVYEKISCLDNNFNVEKAFSLLRTNYILLRNDLDWEQLGSVSKKNNPQKISEYIQNKLNTEQEKTFGIIDKNVLQKDEWFNELLKTNSWLDGAPANVVYKINDIQLENEINVKTTNTIVDNQITDFADIISLPMLKTDTNLTFMDNDVNNSNNLKKVNSDFIDLINIQNFSYNKQTYNYDYDLKLDNAANSNLFIKIKENIDNNYILKINGKEYSTDNLSSGWNKIGNVELGNNNKIEYSVKDTSKIDSTNIIKNGDFSSKTDGWELIDTTEGKIGNNKIEAQTTDNNSVIVSTSGHDAGLRQIIENLSTEDYYLLNFDYKNISGDQPDASMEFLSGDDKSLNVTDIENLNSGNSWNNKAYIFKPESAKMLLYFYATDNDTNHTKNEYKNISLVKLPKSNIKDLVFYSQQETNTNSPTVQVTKNSTFLQEYEVKISNASSGYILNFMQSYDKGWKAEIVEDKKYKPDHIVSQGYANGWVIDKTGDYTVKIYYFPQKIILCLFGVSLLSIIFVIIQSLRKHEKKK